jgi:hypothetical protein
MLMKRWCAPQREKEATTTGSSNNTQLAQRMKQLEDFISKISPCYEYDKSQQKNGKSCSALLLYLNLNFQHTLDLQREAKKKNVAEIRRKVEEWKKKKKERKGNFLFSQDFPTSNFSPLSSRSLRVIVSQFSVSATP